jgi:histidine triad (HIT) family protein
LVQEVSQKIQDSSLKPWGFNYLSNEGSIAGQVVMHFHIHIIPKYGKNEGFKIGIGTKYIGDVDKIYNKLQSSKPKKSV